MCLLNLLNLISIAQIAKMGYLLFDIEVVVVIVLTLLSAIKKGAAAFFYKSFIKWGLIAVFIIFFSQMIAQILIGIQINGQTLTEIVVGLFDDSLGMTMEEIKASELWGLFEALVTCVVRLVIIYVGTLLISFVVYPLIKLIFSITGLKKLFVHDKDDNYKPGSTSILIAVFMAVAVLVVKLAIGFGPVYALGTTADMLIDDITQIQEIVPANTGDTVQTDETTEMLSEIGEAVKSPLVTLLNKSDYNISQMYFDYITKTKTEHGDICLLKEYTNIRKCIPVVAKVINLSGDEFDATILLEMDISELIVIFQDAEAMKVLFPIIGDSLKNIPELQELGINIPDDADWTKEYDNFLEFLNSIKTIYNNANSTVAATTADKLDIYVPSSQCLSDVKSMLSSFKKLLFVQVMADYAQNQLDAMEEQQGISSLIKLIKVKDIINYDLDRVAVMLQESYKIFVMEDEFNVLNLSDSQIDSLTVILEQLFNMTFFKDHEAEVIRTIGTEVLQDQIDLNKYDLENIDWENEPKKLADIFKAAQTIIKHADVESLENVNYKELISNCSETDRNALVDALKASDIVNKVGFPFVDEYVKNMLNENGFSVLADKVNFTDMDADTLKSDITHVFGILACLDEVKDDSGYNLTNVETNKTLLHHIFDISFIKGNEAELFEFALDYVGLKQSMIEYGVTLNTVGVDWNLEVDNLAKFIADFFNSGIDPTQFSSITQNITEENKELMKNVLQDLLALQTLRESIPSIVDAFIDMVGMGEEWKSVWLYNQKNVSFTPEEWVDELNNLVDTMVLLNQTEIQFSDIKTEDMEELVPILHSIIKVKSISPNGIVKVINEELKTACNTQTDYLNCDSMTTSEWDSDIDAIFGTDGIYVSFTTFDTNEPDVYRRYGIILDKMLETTLFKTGFYEFLADYIKTMDVYKSTKNPNGILDDADLAKSNLQKVTSWETELSCLDKFDLSGNTQSGEAIGLAVNSVLLRGKVKQYIKDIVEEKGLTSVCDDTSIDNGISGVNAKIALDPTYSWSKEIENINAFADAFTAFNSLTLTATPEEQQTAASNLKTAAQASVFGSIMLSNFLTNNPHLQTLFA